jgi:hypothetical protein
MAAVAAPMALSGEVLAQTPAAAPPPPDLSKVEIKTARNFIRVVWHSLADKPAEKPLLKRILRRS